MTVSPFDEVDMRFPIRFSGKVPSTIAIHEKKGLTACPAGSENCVSSLNSAGYSKFDGLPLTMTPAEAAQRLKRIAFELGKTKLSKESDFYLWFECESEFFGFIDDLEFQIVPDKKVVHVRSKSRLGRKDFGVNRKRVECIRAKWTEK